MRYILTLFASALTLALLLIGAALTYGQAGALNFDNSLKNRPLAENTASVMDPKQWSVPTVMDHLRELPFFEQLSLSLDLKQRWESKNAEDVLKIGRYYIEQLKAYWAARPDLQKEVALEISAEAAGTIVRFGHYFSLMDNLDPETLDKMMRVQEIRGENAQDDGFEVIDHRHPLRQVVVFKYQGGLRPQTVVGAYLQEILGPKNITLVFDPQFDLFSNAAGTFHGDFENKKSKLTITAPLLRDILVAQDLDELQTHEVLAHELGHYQLNFDNFQGKIPLVRGELELDVDNEQERNAIYDYLTEVQDFSLDGVKIDEIYTYGVSVKLLVQQLTTYMKNTPGGLLDLDILDSFMMDIYDYLKLYYGHVYAAYKVTRVLLPSVDQDNFLDEHASRLIRYSMKGRDVIRLPVRIMPKKNRQLVPPSFVVYYTIPEKLLQHPLKLVQKVSSQDADMVELHKQDLMRIREFIHQQSDYLFHTSPQAKKVAQNLQAQLKEYRAHKQGTSVSPQFIRAWSASVEELARAAVNLAKYPPYYIPGQRTVGTP